jgi:hypothetical protein
MKKYSKQDFNTYIQLCDINYNMLNKYEKLYNNTFKNLNLESKFNNEYFNNNNTMLNLKTIHNDLFTLHTKINNRIIKKKLTDISDIETDKNIKKNIKKTEKKIIINCNNVKKDVKNIMKIFHDDYNYLRNIYKFNSDSNLPNIENFDIHNIGDKISGVGGKISDGVSGGINGVFAALKNIIDMFKTISVQIANFGTDFGKILTNIFKSVFGMMLTVFNFIANELIPLIKVLIKFLWSVIEFLPKIIAKIFNIYKNLMLNYIKAPITPIIFFIILFFGLQIYIKNITGLEEPIPSIVMIAICMLIIFHQISYNNNFLVNCDNKITNGIINFFKIKSIKTYFKLSSDFGNNKNKALFELSTLLFKNFPKIIIILLLFILIIKKFMVLSFGQINTQIFDKIKNLL